MTSMKCAAHTPAPAPNAVAAGKHRCMPDMAERIAFAKLDRNDDGRISRDEYVGTKFMPLFEHLQKVEAFKAADTNGDGTLSLKEFIASRRETFDGIHQAPRPTKPTSKLKLGGLLGALVGPFAMVGPLAPLGWAKRLFG